MLTIQDFIVLFIFLFSWLNVLVAMVFYVTVLTVFAPILQSRSRIFLQFAAFLLLLFSLMVPSDYIHKF